MLPLFARKGYLFTGILMTITEMFAVSWPPKNLPDMTMKKLSILTVVVLLFGTSLMAQMKVAGYSFGKPGTDKYEHLEFWTNDGKRAEVN